jgi:hypothetical protein
MFGGTENLILKIAGLVTAVGVLVAAATALFGGGSAPAVLEASFVEAKAEPNVLLEQYEYSNQTTVNAAYEVGAPGSGERFAADSESTRRGLGENRSVSLVRVLSQPLSVE